MAGGGEDPWSCLVFVLPTQSFLSWGSWWWLEWVILAQAGRNGWSVLDSWSISMWPNFPVWARSIACLVRPLSYFFFIFSGIPCLPVFGTPRQILPITLFGYLTGRIKYGQVRYPRKDHPKCGLDAVTLRYYAGADLSHPSRRHHRSNSEVSEVSLWKISPTFLSILIVGLLQTKGVADSRYLLSLFRFSSLFSVCTYLKRVKAFFVIMMMTARTLEVVSCLFCQDSLFFAQTG